MPAKGINRDYNKRSFVKHRTATNKSRYRLSEGEDPLNESPLVTRHCSSSSLDPLERVGFDVSPESSSVKHHSTYGSPKLAGKDLSPDVLRSSKLRKELSPPSHRTRITLSPDTSQEKTIPPDLHRTRHNSDQWDSSIASSQSESSVDLLSGSCDSLDNVTMETPIVNKNRSASSPIRHGESSAIQISSLDKKQVIRNLASITSLAQPDDGKYSKNKEDKCLSPCGPEAQVICSNDLDVSSHDNSVLHVNTGVSHDPNNVSHNPTSLLRDPDETPRNDVVDQSPSDTSSQSFHVEYLDSPARHSLHDIAEEPDGVMSREADQQKPPLQPTTSMQSIGEHM